MPARRKTFQEEFSKSYDNLLEHLIGEIRVESVVY